MQQTKEHAAATSAISKWRDFFTEEQQKRAAYRSQCNTHQNLVTRSVQQQQLAGKSEPDFADHVLLIFDYLDQNSDGVISLPEIKQSILTPPAHFGGKDIAVLHLLHLYYEQLIELCDDEEGRPDSGISHADLAILKQCLIMRRDYMQMCDFR